VTINGNKAQVFIDGRWSKWLLIAEAITYEHIHKVQRYLELLRAGQQIIGLRTDIPAMEEARDLFTAERRAAENSPTQAD
jgi:hypothetical protein